MKCIDDRNCHIIHEPAKRRKREKKKITFEIMMLDLFLCLLLKKKEKYYIGRTKACEHHVDIKQTFLLLCRLVNITRVIN